MMQLIVREEAEWDIREALSWYASQRPGLELEFLDALRDVLSFLERWPGKAMRVKGAIRRLPYSIIHTVTKEELVILRVFHHRRDPRGAVRMRRRSS